MKSSLHIYSSNFSVAIFFFFSLESFSSSSDRSDKRDASPGVKQGCAMGDRQTSDPPLAPAGGGPAGPLRRAGESRRVFIPS